MQKTHSTLSVLFTILFSLIVSPVFAQTNVSVMAGLAAHGNSGWDPYSLTLNFLAENYSQNTDCRFDGIYDFAKKYDGKGFMTDWNGSLSIYANSGIGIASQGGYVYWRGNGWYKYNINGGIGLAQRWGINDSINVRQHYLKTFFNYQESDRIRKITEKSISVVYQRNFGIGYINEPLVWQSHVRIGFDYQLETNDPQYSNRKSVWWSFQRNIDDRWTLILSQGLYLYQDPSTQERLWSARSDIMFGVRLK